MSEARIDYVAAGGVATLTLRQPAKMNAMTFDMWRALPGLVARAQADDAVRLVVLTGHGDRAFCAGADISQFADQRTGDDAVQAYEDAVSGALAALSTCEKPTLARICGVAFGGGLALALSCDLRLGPSDARLRIPAARLGLGYAFANVEALLARIGPGAAADILLSARIVDGREGERLGLLTKAWDAADFAREADAYVAAIAQNAPLTLRAMKRALVEAAKPAAERDRAGAEALVAACFRSTDYVEGQAAFREKRAPVFRGV